VPLTDPFRLLSVLHTQVAMRVVFISMFAVFITSVHQVGASTMQAHPCKMALLFHSRNGRSIALHALHGEAATFQPSLSCSLELNHRAYNTCTSHTLFHPSLFTPSTRTHAGSNTTRVCAVVGVA
jgi:hypothetical protein